MIRLFATTVIFIYLTARAFAGDCPVDTAFGLPHSDKVVIDVCHTGYHSAYDETAKIPRWVEYQLTGPHAVGCIKRGNWFHPEETVANSPVPKDYTRSGYDRGHQAPAGDFAWDKAEDRDTFSMANMAPQRPGLNREEWVELEETVRAWAQDRGPLTILVGPVIGVNDATISARKIDVPVGFWKVIVDKDGKAIAFYMENKTIAKGDLTPYITTIANIEKLTGLTLPVKESESELWPVDLTAWKEKHTAVCKLVNETEAKRKKSWKKPNHFGHRGHSGARSRHSSAYSSPASACMSIPLRSRISLKAGSRLSTAY
jgi:endonuclease G, mitochondrial